MKNFKSWVSSDVFRAAVLGFLIVWFAASIMMSRQLSDRRAGCDDLRSVSVVAAGASHYRDAFAQACP